MRTKLVWLLAIFIVFGDCLRAQSDQEKLWSSKTFEGLQFRSIGPAFMSGRIADIAIHPSDDNVWYVAVGSGGVWKTTNAGVTWHPIFDDQPSFSIGCVTIDPNDPSRVWVGTGENVGGRHVGFGDGIYLSEDGGKTWKNMGLKNSDHISKIIVHPNNSDIVWVAAQGPLWSSGGERGVYKTTNGGSTWDQILAGDEWTGATDLVIDPRDPNVLYAAMWQRHRTIAAYLGGGPGSGIHRTADGGDNWEKLTSGLPESNMGKIGLAISPQKPDHLYAAIELDNRTGGVYKSYNQGSTWTKQSDAVSGATGPHYYQELYASPHAYDRIYLVDVRMQISDNGGKTFRRMKEINKHSDNHALAFRKDDPDYLLVGTDGGLYESFDLAQNWRFFANLPLTQFYDIALDDAEPFYNVYGGTQDNNTQGGPSRTDNIQGIQNGDWRVVLDWDGHQPATEPGNPNIMYGQRQQGTLSRIDLKTGEVVDIQPQPTSDEDYERYNWDAPILVSSHDPKRIYFASQRLWRSDNRGDSWTAISGDLTKDQERITLPIMGRQQSYNNPWDFFAMSNFNTITAIAESPVDEDLIMIGTDDGHIQMTEDGGDNWTKIMVSSLPGVPATAYVNDIKADLNDENVFYIALDNHKYGDYQPYVLKTNNKGKSWTSINNNLPDRNLTWRIVQDHVNPELLFLGTEFGLYYSPNSGDHWVPLKGGLPTISIRDLKIHRRESDLVVATFGRGIYILDDITPLREISEGTLKEKFALFPVKDAWWYFQRPDLSFRPDAGSQGAAHYIAPNPPYGATFTYYISDSISNPEDQRKAKEKKLTEEGKDIPFPGWEALAAESFKDRHDLWFVIKDADGQIVNKLKAKTAKGIHRISWDLTYSVPPIVDMDGKVDKMDNSFLVPPGTYSVGMYREVEGRLEELDDSQTFEVKQLYEGTLSGADQETVAEFWRSLESAQRRAELLTSRMTKRNKQVNKLYEAYALTTLNDPGIEQRLEILRRDLFELDNLINGNKAKRRNGEKTKPTIGNYLFAAYRTVYHSSYGPTQTAQQCLDIANQKMDDASVKLDDIERGINSVLDTLKKDQILILD